MTALTQPYRRLVGLDVYICYKDVIHVMTQLNVSGHSCSKDTASFVIFSIIVYAKTLQFIRRKK